MRTIYEKELLQYFHSVIGYVFLAIFVLICGYFFLVSNLLTRSGDISDYFQKIDDEFKNHNRDPYWFFGHYHDNRTPDHHKYLLYEQIIQIA